MTQQTRTANKAKFEQGDTPQGSDYVDLIDSFLSLADTTAQSVASPLSITGALGVSTEVSANTVTATTIQGTTVSGALVVGASASFTALNVGGAPISPSTLAAKCDIFIESTALATCSATAAFISVVATASSNIAPVNFSAASTSVRVTYTGADEKVFEAHGMISAKMNAGTNKDVQFALVRNGTVIGGSVITRRIANTSDFGAIAIGALVTMSATDTLEIGVRNTTDTNNIDVASAVMFLSEA